MTIFTNDAGYSMEIRDPRLLHLGQQWLAIGRMQVETEREWIAHLRLQLIDAAHPDDGWVDREKNEVCLSYPQFDDGVRVGGAIALGWPNKYRIVTITGVRHSPLGLTYWSFEEWRE
jgi:hypothetical protein